MPSSDWPSDWPEWPNPSGTHVLGDNSVSFIGTIVPVIIGLASAVVFITIIVLAITAVRRAKNVTINVGPDKEKTVELKVEYCDHCGNRLEQTMAKCPSCGAGRHR
ncbi:MAG: DUF2321 domain-containing protein [Christensenellaceae bacterium]|jgi:hypothetical protein|nr:DUF2321 domain-containing protein [Christensenellaceae bacterium]